MVLFTDYEGPDQICVDEQADLGFHCLHMPEETFCIAQPK